MLLNRNLKAAARKYESLHGGSKIIQLRRFINFVIKGGNKCDLTCTGETVSTGICNTIEKHCTFRGEPEKYVLRTRRTDADPVSCPELSDTDWREPCAHPPLSLGSCL